MRARKEQGIVRRLNDPQKGSKISCRGLKSFRGRKKKVHRMKKNVLVEDAGSSRRWRKRSRKRRRRRRRRRRER